MHRKNDVQTTIYDFILPFCGHLKEDNRWVKFHNMIDWEIVDEEYRCNFENKGRQLFIWVQGRSVLRRSRGRPSPSQ